MTLSEVKNASIEAATLGLLPLGFAVIRRWRSHHLYPDIVGEMQLTLLKGIYRIKEGAIDHHENVSSYLCVRIRGQTFKMLKAESRRWMERVKDSAVVFDSLNFEIADLIVNSLNESDQKIVTLLLAGHSEVEIGNLQGLSRRTVSRRRVHICRTLKLGSKDISSSPRTRRKRGIYSELNPALSS